MAKCGYWFCCAAFDAKHQVPALWWRCVRRCGARCAETMCRSGFRSCQKRSGQRPKGHPGDSGGSIAGSIRAACVPAIRSGTSGGDPVDYPLGGGHMRNDGIRTQGDLPGLRRPAGSHPSESARQSPRMRLRASRLTRSGRDGATSKRPLLDESRDTRGAVSAITGQPLTRLGESAPTSPGFYVIAYDGEAEPYDSVRASGTTLDCGGWPLYAGAARDLRDLNRCRPAP